MIPRKGRQENEGVTLVAPVRETPAVKIDEYGQEGELFQYPYPLGETEFLVAYHPIGWPWADGYGVRTGVYLVTIDGRRELLARDATLPCSQPVPVRARTVRQRRASHVDDNQTEGTCYVQDVYLGAGTLRRAARHGENAPRRVTRFPRGGNRGERKRRTRRRRAGQYADLDR